MKIMIDTNIIISAALFPNGKAARAFLKALFSPYTPLACDYVVDELHRKFGAVNKSKVIWPDPDRKDWLPPIGTKSTSGIFFYPKMDLGKGPAASGLFLLR